MPDLTDLTTLTDDDLDALRRDVLIEQERRATVASAADRIRATVADAVNAGVTDETVRDAVEDGLTPQEQALTVRD